MTNPLSSSPATFRINLWHRGLMPVIKIHRDHQKPLPEAKSAIESLAKGIAEHFAIEYEWEGYTLHFHRVGVSGQIGVTETRVQVLVDISFLMIPIKSAIEDEIRRHLEREFAE